MCRISSRPLGLLRLYVAIVGIVSVGPLSVICAQEKSPEKLAFFEAKIRPVLVQHCYSCHSEKEGVAEGELVLDTRDGIRRGGSSGPAVVPGDVRKSLLMTAISYEKKDFAMPPESEGGKLPDEVIADFRKWISEGAVDPREGKAKVVSRYDDPTIKNWWSFQPIKNHPVPTPKNSNWSEKPIDRFVLAQLEKQGIHPVIDAEPGVLYRRLSYDLLGLPPDGYAQQRFVEAWNNGVDREKLLAQVVDQMLDSPQFGEKWGRHWLDVARYAESAGKDVNVAYPHAWRYRDYVIDVFNKDKPFNEFLEEQIAGDLIQAENPQDRAEQTIATGFLAIGTKSINEMKARQFVVDIADEQIDSVTQAFVGLTVACARCHDHKFDPITQKDYTALAGIFLSTDTRYGTGGGVQGRNAGKLLELPEEAQVTLSKKSLSRDDVAALKKRLEELTAERQQAIADRAGNRQGGNNLDLVRITSQMAQIEVELAAVNADGTPKSLAMGVTEKPIQAPTPGGMFAGRRNGGAGGGPMARRFTGFEQIGDSPLLLRGDIDSPSEKVARGVTGLLDTNAQSVPPTSSGRLELARALTDKSNPFTSRVIVNRIWHWLFGQGIVTSVDNFGTTGSEPSHPELLDYLAIQFVENGWSIKKAVREIVLTRTYRLASTYEESAYQADPENKYLWRHTPRRLEAEEIRDSIMFASGSLKFERPIATLIGNSPDGQIGGERRANISEDQLASSDHSYRSIYLPLARNVLPEILAAFDMPDASAVDGTRETTNVPSQALFMMNSEFVADHAGKLADRVLSNHPGNKATDKLDERMNDLYLATYGRPPTKIEEGAARKLLVRSPTDAKKGWTSIARAVLSSAEFRMVD